ncbi:hypothetical protein [Flexivirga oryzae]|uniref:Uncharacterized protein n=1 Tax=Flexivirga oryzae TaxID=1794944 RepID=A0A839N7A1_9MICO|nr:hypothetical protein [Flexivirga oryzae]MBB2893147.1 hypothetical protein [Flexivirga oryzae]
MSQHHDDDDLERRLRAAFTAKAEQIGPHDLDTDREDAVAALLREPARPGRVRKVVSGIGILAAAAAAVGVVALAIHPSQQHTTTALHPVTTAASTGVVSVAPPTQTTPSTTAGETPHMGQATPDNQVGTQSQPLTTTTTTTTSTSTTTTPPSSSTTRTALSAGGTQGSSSSSTSSSSTPTDRSGAIPLDGQRTVPVPEGLTWEVTAETDRTRTVRITYLPTDIEAWWGTHLPAQGWEESADHGWTIPGTAYAVSPITDKGSFTVTW